MEEAGVLVVLALAVAVACRPWSWSGLWTLPHRDAAFTAVALERWQVLLSHLAPLDSGGLGWPGPAWAQADVLIGQALLGLPLRLLGVGPVRAYELLCLLGLLLTGWAASLVARQLLGPGPHRHVAAVAGGLGATQLWVAPHANLVFHDLGLWAALGLTLGLVQRRPALAFGGGLIGGLAGLFGAYMGLHAGLIVVTTLGLLLLARHADRKSLAAALGGLALGLLPTALAARAWVTAAADLGARQTGDATGLGWDPARSLAAVPGAPLHGGGWSWLPPATDAWLVLPWNPGLVVAALALLGAAAVLRDRDRRWLLVLVPAVLAALLALGPAPAIGGRALPFPGPAALLGDIGANLRSPARWLAVTDLGLALFAARGAALLARPLPRLFAGPLLVGVAALTLLERAPISTVPTRTFVPDRVYAALDDIAEDGALYERFARGCDHDGIPRLWAAMYHGRPVAGGQFARFSARSEQLQRTVTGWPNPRADTVLRRLGVRVVLEHPPVRAETPPDAHCEVIDDHRLCLLPDGVAPSTQAFSRVASGPVVGLRWPQPPDAARIQVSCGERTEVHFRRTWELIADWRPAQGFELLLDEPCPVAVTATPDGADRLYRAGGADPGWLPPLPPRPRRVADMFHDLPANR